MFCLPTPPPIYHTASGLLSGPHIKEPLRTFVGPTCDYPELHTFTSFDQLLHPKLAFMQVKFTSGGFIIKCIYRMVNIVLIL